MVFAFLIVDFFTKERFAEFYFHGNNGDDHRKIARTVYVLNRVEREMKFKVSIELENNIRLGLNGQAAENAMMQQLEGAFGIAQTYLRETTENRDERELFGSPKFIYWKAMQE
jgi:hypothetical protein